MKVRELIDKLQRCTGDLDTEVMLIINDELEAPVKWIFTSTTNLFKGEGELPTIVVYLEGDNKQEVNT